MEVIIEGRQFSKVNIVLQFLASEVIKELNRHFRTLKSKCFQNGWASRDHPANDHYLLYTVKLKV